MPNRTGVTHFRPYMHRPYASSGSSSFTLNQYRSIYNFPPPSITSPLTVAVLSFGGGIFGSISPSGVLSGGDVQAQWASLGMTSMPTVNIVFVDGATNVPNKNDVATIENTLDIATIGALCPSPLLTIILYIGAPRSSFSSVLGAALRANPSIVSISWGLDETNFNRYDSIASVNALLASAVAAGINVTAATGDYGSSNGVPGINVDFPSSSPYLIACGGTTLTCPSGVYSDAGTREITWSGSGGGKSVYNSRPVWQPSSLGSMRATPDIAMNADPNTGVVYLIGGTPMIVGGTSVVSPAFAAFLACIRPSQFVTPLLYTAPSTCFNDILVGTNGFYNAGTGHDKCTGLGSIIGSSLATTLTLAPRYIAPLAKVSLLRLPTTLTLAVGSSSTAAIRVIPAAAILAWTSRNEAAAPVNASTGLITAVAPGTAVITATAADGSDKRASITVTVVQLITDLSIQPTIAIRRGRAAQLALTVSPANATNKSVTWSSDSRLIKVNSKGLVSVSSRAVPGNTVTITARSRDGSNKVATCTVTAQ